MKKIIFTFSLFLSLAVFSQLQAQTTNCTPEQIEACKKICSTIPVNCVAAAQKVVNQKSSCTSAKKVASTASEPTSIFASFFNTGKSSKTSCSPAPPSCHKNATSVKLTKNEKKSSCSAAKPKTAMASVNE